MLLIWTTWALFKAVLTQQRAFGRSSLDIVLEKLRDTVSVIIINVLLSGEFSPSQAK